MKINSFKRFLPHLITWVSLLVLPFIGYFYQPEKQPEINYYFVRIHFATILYMASVFYLNFHVVAPKYFFRASRFKYTFLLILGLCIYILLNYGFYTLNPINLKREVRDQNYFFFRFIVGPTLFYSLCLLTSNMLFLYAVQARQKELNKQIELEKTAAELNMLKLQISPHFLFNTLNNIRWLVRKKSEIAEESVLKLSEILRYIIYDVDGSRVVLAKELDHIKNYLALQQLRIQHTDAVKVNINVPNQEILVEPLLFIHFIENAFKYGVDGTNEPNIQFDFFIEGDFLVFNSSNKILVQTSNLKNEGIGLTNIRRRLELLYPAKHYLNIDQNDENFSVLLKIQYLGH